MDDRTTKADTISEHLGSAPHETTGEVYDEAAALDRACGDPARAQRFLSMLLDLLPRAERSLEEALANDDVDGLRYGAHQISGAASYCGAQALRNAARHMESQVRKGAHADNTDLARRLVAQIERFRAVILASASRRP